MVYDMFVESQHGITQISLKYFKERKKKLGAIISVACGEFPKDSLNWRTVINGTTGTMILSGLSCGYAGEGPHGLYEVLVNLGLENRPFGETDISKLDRIIYMNLKIPISLALRDPLSD